MDYIKAANYWSSREKNLKRIDKNLLRNKIEDFLETHTTCALATGSGNFVRCTPIEYTYYNKCLLLFSEGGLKFVGLEKNKNVSLSVFESYVNFDCLNGLQITGKAEIIDKASKEYTNLATLKNINLKALENFSRELYLIKITPSRIDFLSSEFKKEGYSARQFLEV